MALPQRTVISDDHTPTVWGGGTDMTHHTVDPEWRVPRIELETAGGTPVKLGTFLDRPLLAVAVRYYG
jgi:hypothetical protein